MLPRGLAVVFAFAMTVSAQPASSDEAMVPFPGITFVMGTEIDRIDALLSRFNVKRRELFLAETPAHPVSLRPFLIDRTEVTNSAYKAFLEHHREWQKDRLAGSRHNGSYLQNWAEGSYPNGEEKMPVIFVTWDAAAAFCRAAGKRLPTEAEWEFAASGGRPLEFPWGDEMPDRTKANWSETGLHRPAPVASFPPNGAGLYDMAGNVWEFVEDLWTDNYSSAPGQQSPERRVIRGGSFDAAAINLRVRYRDSHPSIGAGPHVGFRRARAAGTCDLM